MNDQPDSPGKDLGAGSRSGRLWAACSTVLALGILGLAAVWFRGRWLAVAHGGPMPPIRAGWIVAGALLLAAHAAASARLWMLMVRARGARFSLREALDSFVPSLLARYVPGKVWANGTRMFFARKAGIPLGAVTGAVLWETAMALASGGLFAFVMLASAPGHRYLLAAGLLAAVSLTGLVLLGVLSRIGHDGALFRWLRAPEAVRPAFNVVPAAATATGGWILYGAAHVAFALALTPAPPATWPLIAGAVTLAWAGGFLSFFAPAGLGVRDGLLLTLVGTLLDPVRAFFFVAASRLVQFGVDALLTAVWFATLLARRSSRREAVPPGQTTCPGDGSGPAPS